MDKKSGTCQLTPTTDITVVDLPGVYSIYPKSPDEQLVTDILANPAHPDYPDVAVVVLDASNLRRNMLLFTQIMDLRVPVVLALNMLDVAKQQQQEVNAVRLAMRLGVPVVRINARTGEGVDLIKKAVLQQLEAPIVAETLFFDPETDPVLAEAIAAGKPGLLAETAQQCGLNNSYLALQYVIQHDGFTFLNKQQRAGLDVLIDKYQFSEPAFQVRETIRRYELIAGIITDAVTNNRPVGQPTWSQKLDRFLLHPVWGYMIFGGILLLIFQAIFAWAQPLWTPSMRA